MKSIGDGRNFESMLGTPPKPGITKGEGKISISGMESYIGKHPIEGFITSMPSSEGEGESLKQQILDILLGDNSPSDKAHLLELFVERQTATFAEELSKLLDERNLLDTLYNFYEDCQIIPQQSLEQYKSSIGEILHQAITLHLHNAMKFFVKACADVSLKSGLLGITPLHYAAALSGNAEAVVFLVNNGAKVNLVDERVRTPLCVAVEISKNAEAMLSLLHAGAEVPDNLRERVDALLKERDMRLQKKAVEIPEVLQDSSIISAKEEDSTLLQRDDRAPVEDQQASISPEAAPDLSSLQDPECAPDQYEMLGKDGAAASEG